MTEEGWRQRSVLLLHEEVPSWGTRGRGHEVKQETQNANTKMAYGNGPC